VSWRRVRRLPASRVPALLMQSAGVADFLIPALAQIGLVRAEQPGPGQLGAIARPAR